MSSSSAPLEGLVVVDFSTTTPGVQATQLLADFGAEVIGIEPPGGHPLRRLASFPFLARGRRSIELDFSDGEDLEVARSLARSADVVVETFRPGVADRLGFGYDELAASNPRLVFGSVTGFGSNGPYASLQGYEGIVMAKFGVFSALSEMTARPGPSFPSAPYASYPASQLLAQGLLAALLEREQSGRGQRVETTLAQGLSVHDTFGWFTRLLGSRYGGGFNQVPLAIDGIPTGGLSFRLLIALTKDGKWVQFSQTAPRLFRAMMKVFDLDWMFDDPRFASAPDFDDVAARVEFWEVLLGAVRSKTAAEWSAVFDQNPDVWAEVFAKGPDVLNHPQLLWNRQVETIEDLDVGPVRQPGRLVQLEGIPLEQVRSAPRLDDDGPALRERAEQLGAPSSAQTIGPEAGADASRRPVLDRVTILELSTYYAAPFGATLLAEYGARVIKIEQLDGDPMRNMMPFPEIAGIKAVQGKESLAVDIATDEGREIVYELAREADVVLQGFRAGVAKRLQVDAESLRAVNPNLVYLNAPGYGTGGPYGGRPAYAPTIGAAAGLAWRNVGAMIPEGPDLTLDEVKRSAIPMALAVMGGGNCDGFASVSVASAMMLGLLARKRGLGGQSMLTTMIGSATHALSDGIVTFGGAPAPPTADLELHGFGATYRLYEAADGWVFLAAPSDREFAALAIALDPTGELPADRRFSTEVGRDENEGELTAALSEIFRERAASRWESELRAVDVACVEVAPGPIEANFLDEGSIGQECGFSTEAFHSMLDTHSRLVAHVAMSRSASVTGGGCLVGQHTEDIMAELGYGDVRIAELRGSGVLGS